MTQWRKEQPRSNTDVIAEAFKAFKENKQGHEFPDGVKQLGFYLRRKVPLLDEMNRLRKLHDIPKDFFQPKDSSSLHLQKLQRLQKMLEDFQGQPLLNLETI
jgi:hypothetical protein